MNTLYWLVTITDRPTTDAFLKLYQSFGVNVSLRTVGAGTAIQETLSTLGLEKTEKAVLLPSLRRTAGPASRKPCAVRCALMCRAPASHSSSR